MNMRDNHRIISMTSIIMLTMCFWASAQMPPQGPISIQSSILTFPNPKNGPEVYVEFPFAINRNQFSFVLYDSVGAIYEGSIFAEVLIYDTLGNHLDSASSYFGIKAKDPDDAQRTDIRLFDKVYMMLLPGIYTGELNIMDVASKREGSFLFERFQVPPIIADSLSLSDLELAYDIELIEDTVRASHLRLCKNGRNIIPNPMGLFSQSDTMLSIYAELYNLSYDSSNGDNFSLDYKVYQDNGALRLDLGETSIPKPGRTSIISSSLKIGDLGPGRYILKLTATDPKTGKTDASARQFIIIPASGFKPSTVTVSKSNPLDTASLTTKSNIVRYLMTAQELALFNNLNDSGKVRFVRQFFKDKDPTSATEANEYLEDAFRRYSYANEHFPSLPGLNDGWRSDRGRVLLQYGQWDERDEETSPAYGSPWERWYYHSIQGGVLFIFVDKEGLGNFKLVHSTANGEVFNSEWNQKVQDENLQTY